MFRRIRPAFVVFAFFMILTGLIYPLLITGATKLLFPWQANGSVLQTSDGRRVGSALIGQPFSDPRYFWGRLSDTTGGPYNASASGGSNFSALNGALQKQVQERLDALRSVDPGNTEPVPVDLVTASASGLDPHISPAAAYYQVSRVARERNLDEESVRSLVEESIETPFLGLLGEPRVNVLKLNLALDSLQ